MSEHRVKFAALFDAEVRPHNERFRVAAAITRGEDMLDVGCGTGESTREAALASETGHVLGVDVSAAAITRARELGGAAFEVADAQTRPFPAPGFDVVLSQFGAMFFADPPATFANLARALRPGGRLVLLVWQERARNEWYAALHDAVAPGTTPTARRSALLPRRHEETTRALLEGAGFTGASSRYFNDVDEPAATGPDSATATGFALGLKDVQELAGTEGAAERLRVAFAGHETDDGVLLGSRAWIVKAVSRG